jgi:hypothetical protein
MNLLPSKLKPLVAAVLAVAAVGAHAADLSFSGNLVFNTDVVKIAFDVGPAAGDVALWTDSWHGGLNFDPSLTVWSKAGSDYQLLVEPGDDNSIGPGQGAFDDGVKLASLAAGHYLVTLTPWPNSAAGPLLSNGFDPQGEVRTPIAQWNQPGYDLNANDQKGTQWSLHLNGVSQAAMVPEPSSMALLALGLAVIGAAGVRRSRQG